MTVGDEEVDELRDVGCEREVEQFGDEDRRWYSRVRSIINLSRNTEGLEALVVTQEVVVGSCCCGMHAGDGEGDEVEEEDKGEGVEQREGLEDAGYDMVARRGAEAVMVSRILGS